MISVHKQKVLDTIEKRYLSSVMNNTKWEQLQHAVLHELAFPPAYQIKYVLDEAPYPEAFENDVWYMGDWIEPLIPFYAVEWIRIRPRVERSRGRLLSPEIINIADDFISMLRGLHIPFREDKDTIYIYGYISDPGVLTSERC
ncbi:hypothetical protein M3231_10995 [Neobacillus mesonae]|nr:hypothetical protein [Neobacillus mesonae]